MRSSLTLRSSIAVAGLAVAASAYAGNTTIVTNALVADSVQAFSTDAAGAFEVQSVSVTPLGNATAVSGAATPSFSLPITSITIDSKLQIVSGDAKGSALKFARTTTAGTEVWVVLANFTIDYVNKKVLADTTIPGVATVKQQAIYSFATSSALSIKYKFPLSITGHEVLNQLMLTEETKDSFMNGLKLYSFIRAVLDATDFGTLTQDIAVKLRSKPVSTKLYTVSQTTAQ